MSEPLSIALIGLGEVGRTLAEDLVARGGVRLSAWDLKFADAGSAPARALAGLDVRAGADAADAVRGAELVISAVTAAQTEAAADAAVPGLARGAAYLDLNSASPSLKKAAAAAVEAAGADYVEAAVMSPIGPKRIGAPMLLGGPRAEALAPRLQALGFAGARFYAPEVGRASAAKLSRSVIVKGVEAILAESLLTARHYGVEADVIASLNDLFPGPDWRKLSHYMIVRSIEHGVRRAEEMREAARTVADAGVDPLMSTATARRQDWAARFAPQLDRQDLLDLLDGVLAQAEATHGKAAC